MTYKSDSAEQAGVSITTVHYYEVGKNNIRPNTEKRIKEVYNEIYNDMRYGSIVLALAMELKYTKNRKAKKLIKEDILKYLDKV